MAIPDLKWNDDSPQTSTLFALCCRPFWILKKALINIQMVPSVIAYIHTQYTLGFSKHYKHKTNLAHLSCSLYTKWRNDSWKFTSCGDLVWSSVHTVKDSVWSPAHTVRDSVWSPVHTVRDSVGSPVHTARDSVWNYVLYCKRFSL